MIFNGELNEKDHGKLALDITTIMGNARKNKSEIIKFSKKYSEKHNKKVRYLTHWFKDIEKLKSSQIECFESIGKKMIEILEENHCNINKDDYIIEAQRRNGGFSKEKNRSPFIWHQDGEKSVTIIFYIRKDANILGGNLMIDERFSNGFRDYFKSSDLVKEIDIYERQCLIFDGEMYHKPMDFSGFGCRDIIVGQFNRIT